MRKLTTCPRCEDEYLVIIREKGWARLLCHECGWSHTFAPKPAEEELVDAIEGVVAEAKGVAAQGGEG